MLGWLRGVGGAPSLALVAAGLGQLELAMGWLCGIGETASSFSSSVSSETRGRLAGRAGVDTLVDGASFAGLFPVVGFFMVLAAVMFAGFFVAAAVAFVGFFGLTVAAVFAGSLVAAVVFAGLPLPFVAVVFAGFFAAGAPFVFVFAGFFVAAGTFVLAGLPLPLMQLCSPGPLPLPSWSRWRASLGLPACLRLKSHAQACCCRWHSRRRSR